MVVIIMCFVVPVAVVIATLVISLAMVEKFCQEMHNYFEGHEEGDGD